MVQENTIPDENFMKKDDFTFETPLIDEREEKRKVLLVEDNMELLQVLKEIFSPLYQVVTAANGEEGLKQVFAEVPDLIVSDVMMPVMTGTEMCLKIKNNISLCHIPVVLLTALDTVDQNIEGLRRGADDYITKPFSLSVLRARVNTQLRKAAAMGEKEKDNEHVYRKEPYVFDFDRMKFMVDGKEIELSKTEQKLLRILVENAGMNMRRELLLDRVWSDGAEYVDENALSVSVKRLRDKLGAEHAIRTVYGIGYRWE